MQHFQPLPMLLLRTILLALLGCVSSIFGETLVAQPITGVWRGQMVRGKGLRESTAPIEVKLIAYGDSIRGTVYYYKNSKAFIRYSLKGYFDLVDGSVVWQDYHMVEIAPKKTKDAMEAGGLMHFRADYSCPDGKTIRLNGECGLPNGQQMELELKKVNGPIFPDEWDQVIEGYYAGMNRREVLDSVWALVSEPVGSTEGGPLIASTKGEPAGMPDTAKIVQENLTKAPPAITFSPPDAVKNIDSQAVAKTTISQPTPKVQEKAREVSKPTAPVDITAEVAKSNAEKNRASPSAGIKNTPPQPKAETPVLPTQNIPITTGATIINSGNGIASPVMATAFNARKKIVQTEIPIAGDTLELRFYDNAEVDGDSISLFMNGVALFQHIRLEVRPYIFKIPLNQIQGEADITMVAENLGAIPPNTAYMEAFVNGHRYSARLESTESSSAVVRLRKLE